MRIVGDSGAVRHAWLDAGLLHDTCRGFRCRIAIGTAGGLVCDLVTGDRPLSSSGVSGLAMAAVANVQPSDRDALPLVDDEGGPVLVIDDDRAVLRPVDANPEAPARPSTIAALLMIGLAGLIGFNTDDLAAQCVGGFLAVMSAIGLYVVIGRAGASRANHRVVDDPRAAREDERRLAAPTSVTITG